MLPAALLVVFVDSMFSVPAVTFNVPVLVKVAGLMVYDPATSYSRVPLFTRVVAELWLM